MVEISFKDGDKISVAGKAQISNPEIDFVVLGPGRLHILKDNKSYSVEFDPDAKIEGQNVVFKLNSKRVEVSVRSESDILLESLGINQNKISAIASLKAPMPGLIFQLMVQAGDIIEAGSPLLVLEAMKMENVIKASATLKVAKVYVKIGDKVEKGQLLLEFDS